MSERHQEWRGDDAPEECVVCEKPWPCIDAYLDEQERADRLTKALERIAEMDYRGNEPQERRIAREALKA